MLSWEVDEIELSQGFFDFDEKYTLATSKIHMPARIDIKLKNQIKEQARHIVQSAGLQRLCQGGFFCCQGGGACI